MRAQNQKVAAIRFAAQPAKRFVQIAAPAHHGDSSLSAGLHVLRVALANVLEVGREARRGTAVKHEADKQGRREFHDLDDYTA